jgi:3-methyladenine DNA glycosylase AlkD
VIKTTEIVASIRRDLRKLPSVTVPTVRPVRRKYSKSLAGAAPDAVLKVARSLLVEGDWPERMIAFELIAGHPATMRELDDKIVDELATGLADWGSIDLFGVAISGVAWREGRITNSHVMRWVRSKDRWMRRLALVSTVPLNIRSRGGTGDVDRTLMVCRALVDDRDDMVVKAMSWALRELAKREPAAVQAFVAEEDARLAPRVRREVRTKLETGRKNKGRT